METIVIIGMSVIIVLLLSLHSRTGCSKPYSLNRKLRQIMASQAEHAAELRAVKEQNDKARAEILAKIAELEQAIIDAGNTTPEVDAALAELKASVQTDDDIVPDPEA